jgi:hypothetical protein
MHEQGGDIGKFATYSKIYFEGIVDKRRFANSLLQKFRSGLQEASMAEH